MFRLALNLRHNPCRNLAACSSSGVTPSPSSASILGSMQRSGHLIYSAPLIFGGGLTLSIFGRDAVSQLTTRARVWLPPIAGFNVRRVSE